MKTNLIGLAGQTRSGKDTVAKMVQYYFYLKKLDSKHEPEYTLEEFLSGKDIYNTVYKVNYDYSNSISEDSGWTVKKIAYKLKQIAAILIGCSAEDFEKEEFKNQLLPKEWQYDYTIDCENGKLTNRWLLQRLGTEAVRNNINKVVWINALFADFQPQIKNATQEDNLNMDNGILRRTTSYPNWIISDVRFLNEAKAITDRGGVIIKIVRDGVHAFDHSSETELKNIEADYIIFNNGTIDKLYEEVVYALENLITK